MGNTRIVVNIFDLCITYIDQEVEKTPLTSEKSCVSTFYCIPFWGEWRKHIRPRFSFDIRGKVRRHI